MKRVFTALVIALAIDVLSPFTLSSTTSMFPDIPFAKPDMKSGIQDS